MYKIMLVDDETQVREAIIEMVPWEECGFTVVGQAANGRDALEVLDSVTTDVVITDIKMPIMDGIEFIKAVREIQPLIKIVILSGFGEFEYAKDAISLNVIEYLLKPVSVAGLTKTLNSIREKLDAENEDRLNVEQMREEYVDNLPVLRENFLLSLMLNPYETQSIKARSESLEMDLSGPAFVVIAVNCTKLSHSLFYYAPKGMEVMMLSIKSIARDICEKYFHAHVVLNGENILLLASDSADKIDAFLPIAVKEIQQDFSKHYGLQVTIGISEHFYDVAQTRKAYEQCISALGYRIVAGKTGIIYIGDIERQYSATIVLTEDDELRLNSIMKSGTREELGEFTDKLFAMLSASVTSVADCQIFMIELFAVLIKSTKNLTEDIQKRITQNIGLITDLHKYDSIDTLKHNFQELCLEIMDNVASTRADATDQWATQGYDYIMNRYADPDLSLKTVSDSLHISSSYFGAVFKKVWKDSFTNILIKRRMQRAYDLVTTTNLKILQIAAETGYTDQHYFSYCFKKYYGKSVSEVRGQIK